MVYSLFTHSVLFIYLDTVVLERVMFVFDAGLSKFAKLARSVTRSRSVLVSQFSSHLPNLKDTTKQSNLAHVSTRAIAAS